MSLAGLHVAKGDVNFRGATSMSQLGQVRLCRLRPPTVRFSFHCRRSAALPRTGGLGQFLTQ
jgi:hypothetical protein